MDVSPLAEQPCLPSCEKTALLSSDEAYHYLEGLDGWSITETGPLYRRFEFRDFATALSFTNALGALAEMVGHHPDIGLGWGRVEVSVWSHDLDGLQRADFILAARIDRIPRS
jgi:4a-hydroxytetrahydrobiopterin dehydratase